MIILPQIVFQILGTFYQNIMVFDVGEITHTPNELEFAISKSIKTPFRKLKLYTMGFLTEIWPSTDRVSNFNLNA